MADDLRALEARLDARFEALRAEVREVARSTRDGLDGLASETSSLKVEQAGQAASLRAVARDVRRIEGAVGGQGEKNSKMGAAIADLERWRERLTGADGVKAEQRKFALSVAEKALVAILVPALLGIGAMLGWFWYGGGATILAGR